MGTLWNNMSKSVFTVYSVTYYFVSVVYEHRARLERSLQKEKADHKNTKLGW